MDQFSAFKVCLLLCLVQSGNVLGAFGDWSHIFLNVQTWWAECVTFLRPDDCVQYNTCTLQRMKEARCARFLLSGTSLCWGVQTFHLKLHDPHTMTEPVLPSPWRFQPETIKKKLFFTSRIRASFTVFFSHCKSNQAQDPTLYFVSERLLKLNIEW